MTNFASSNPHLCSNLDRPNYCHDNPYIFNGYRKPGGTTAAKYLNQTLAHSRKTSNNVQTPPEKRRRTLSTHSECQDPLSPLDEELSSQETGGLILEKGHTKIRPPRSIFKASEALEVNTYLKSLKSLAYWHNESINIHTHLWGSVISIIILSLHLLAYFSLLPTSLLPFTHHSIFLPPVLKTSSRLSEIFSLSLRATQRGNDVEQIWERGNDWKDILSFASYLLAAGACFACSAAFHTCQCISKDVARKFQKLDYLGIVILAAGSYLPTLHYGFFCHPNHFSLYILSVSILALGCLWVTFDPLWATPAYRPYRTSVFITLGLSALGPTYHASSIYGFETLTYTMGFEYLAASGIIYILGACIYVLQAPERFLPGKFDYIGSSHQIFHTFILIAAFLQYVAVRRSYHFWSTVEVLSEIQSQNPQWFGKEMICKVLESSSSSSATSY